MSFKLSFIPYSFNDVVNTLSKIPILPGLLSNAVESMEGDDPKSKDENIAEAMPENSASNMPTAATSDENETMAVSKKSNSSAEDWQRQREEKVTLLQWISTKDNQSTLEQMVDQCARGLEQVSPLSMVLHILLSKVELYLKELPEFLFAA